jgi:hypothetical protein
MSPRYAARAVFVGIHPFGDSSMLSQRHAVAAAAVVCIVAACNHDAPVQSDSHLSHHNGLTLASLSQQGNGEPLAPLRKLTAPFHDIEFAQRSGYSLFKAPPLTSPDGCISSAADGGMGYHYTRGNNLADDSVSLLDPEFIVYAPTQVGQPGSRTKRQLAAFDYFIPYSAKWPGPTDPAFQRAPTLHDFSTMQDLPNVTFAPSRFDGWMFHIWLWEKNPGGMFANWNTAVPLCQSSSF